LQTRQAARCVSAKASGEAVKSFRANLGRLVRTGSHWKILSYLSLRHFAATAHMLDFPMHPIQCRLRILCQPCLKLQAGQAKALASEPDPLIGVALLVRSAAE
jgi:hypothetical protein